jgi:mutual gliding-motility protein MglA
VAFIDYSKHEISCKLVYCGPGLSGKTTNIVRIFQSVQPEARGELVSLYTSFKRTLFFDFLPIELGDIAGFKVRFHLYSVPGQACYSAVRRLVFRGADGLVFVADSARERMDANLEAIRDLYENMEFYKYPVSEMPLVFQLNKRDLEDANPADYLKEELCTPGTPVFEASAYRNIGVRETFMEVGRRVMAEVRDGLDQDLSV